MHPGGRSTVGDAAALETVTGLIERGWRVTLAAPPHSALLAPARQRGALTAETGTPLRAFGHLRRMQPDVVLVGATSLWVWVIAARLLRFPVAVSARGGHRVSTALRLAAVADVVIVPSESQRNAVATALRSRTTRVHTLLPPMMAPREFTPPREHLEGPVRLLHLGSLTEAGGVDVALEAIDLLAADGIDARLTLLDADVTAGSQAVEGRVTLAPSGHSPWSALRGSDIVLVPARQEDAAGAAPVRALLAGRPAVVSAIGGIADAVADFPSAVAVHPGDPVALASSVQRIVVNWSAFRRTALATAPMAARRYDGEQYRAALASLVDRVTTPIGSEPLSAR